ncbi:RluA family pseudouridine synthase [Candidatus Peregrinibacteria bacterium]|nr:MAG: RluA family pseudouridine synthase [Candidatus Peregrinibacteria bacterium]
MQKNIIHIEDADDGMKLKKWIRKAFPAVPLSALHRHLRKKNVKWNGKRANGEEVLATGDAIECFFGEEIQTPKQNSLETVKVFSGPKFSVLLEDDFVLVINKPAGVAVQPGSDIPKGSSVVERLSAEYAEQVIRPVHRLDKDTSGALVFAKRGKALRTLHESLRNGEWKKEYRAVVAGILPKKTGTIDASILRERDGSRQDSEGKNAITHYRVEQTGSLLLSDETNIDVSELRLQIDTGRMHQIRIHLSGMKNPVLGDKKYGDFPLNRLLQKEIGLRRQFLHAEHLSFPHPELSETIFIVAPLPEDLVNVFKSFSF